MRWIVLVAILLVMPQLVPADEGIIRVEQGDVVIADQNVTIYFDHQPVASTDQIQVFVDGALYMAVGGRNTVSLDLEAGNHNIKIRNATRDHRLRQSCKSVKVIVGSVGSIKAIEECK